MLFLGGAHQLFHLAPVAAALSRLDPGKTITCIASDPHIAELLSEIRDRMGAASMRIETIQSPAWVRKLARLIKWPKLSKLSLLLKLAMRLWSVTAIVTPERTSSILRRWHLTRARLIHFRHGAGDRAPKSEQQLSAFDLIVVPGDKDLERAVEQQHVDPARLQTVGYVKLDYLLRQPAAALRLFDNDWPTILYNPHFDRSISSWDLAPAIVDHILADGRYNLVLAPHIRVAEKLGAADIAQWHARADPDRLIMDFGSDRLIDMSYIRAADIYLGDMSSQLYEFLATPRPVVFVNAHCADWRVNARYAGWHLGEVADAPDQLIAAIDRAVANQPATIERQRAAVTRAFGRIDGACERAAHILVEAFARQDATPTDGTADIAPLRA